MEEALLTGGFGAKAGAGVFGDDAEEGVVAGDAVGAAGAYIYRHPESGGTVTFEGFDDWPTATLTLFVVTTLDGWSSIMWRVQVREESRDTRTRRHSLSGTSSCCSLSLFRSA